MKLVIATAVAALIAPGHPMQSKAPPAEKPFQIALMCFKSGEKVSGMNKICYYNCGGSEAAITVASTQLCPLSIDR